MTIDQLNPSGEELKYTTLYDHYKDTVSYLKKDLIKRDKLTLYLFGSILLYFLVEIKPSDSVNIANTFVKSKVGTPLDINYSILSTAVLLFLLWSVIRYFQLCLYIEKQYNYIHELEGKINLAFGQKLITREGYSYLKEYPLLTALIHRIYNFFLPIGISFSMLVKIVIVPFHDFSFLYFVNIFTQFLIILCSFLYLLFSYRDIEFVQKLNSTVKSLFIKIHLYKED